MLEIQKDLILLGNDEKAKNSARFFKSGVGQYGEGDVFIGVTIPEQRKIAKKYKDLKLSDVLVLLRSKEHEFRMTALLILVEQFENGDQKQREKIYNTYLSNTKWINNWDLVDASAAYIVGEWLEDKKDKMRILEELAESKDLWEKRIAMVATFTYIKNGSSKEAFKIAKILLEDKHDLIQKAVGWMLREVGKRCSRELMEEFIQLNYSKMSRTTLRYSIEHLTIDRRKIYLTGIFN
jgi:3-methyladenine DNA glycosylase AlkD